MADIVRTSNGVSYVFPESTPENVIDAAMQVVVLYEAVGKSELGYTSIAMTNPWTKVTNVVSLCEIITWRVEFEKLQSRLEEWSLRNEKACAAEGFSWKRLLAQCVTLFDESSEDLLNWPAYVAEMRTKLYNVRGGEGNREIEWLEDFLAVEEAGSLYGLRSERLMCPVGLMIDRLTCADMEQSSLPQGEVAVAAALVNKLVQSKVDIHGVAGENRAKELFFDAEGIVIAMCRKYVDVAYDPLAALESYTNLAQTWSREYLVRDWPHIAADEAAAQAVFRRIGASLMCAYEFWFMRSIAMACRHKTIDAVGVERLFASVRGARAGPD